MRPPLSAGDSPGWAKDTGWAYLSWVYPGPNKGKRRSKALEGRRGPGREIVQTAHAKGPKFYPMV